MISIIEILTDKMIDVDERPTDELEIFAVTDGDQKHVEINEWKMMCGDRKLLRRAKGGRLGVVAVS